MREGIAYKSLSVVCTKITDGSHFSPKADENGSYPMLSVKDMMASGFEYTSCKYINEHDYKVLVANGCKPKFNDVLVAKDGSYLKTAFVLKEEREQAVLSSIAIITPRLDEINPDYLAFFFKAPYTKAVVEKHYLTGTAIKRIIIKGFRGIKIPIPPLSEQHRIVSELELLSGIIEKKKAQLKEYDQLAQSIFYDMFGDPVTNEKGWEVKTVGEIASFYNGKAHENDIDENGQYILVNAKFISSEGEIIKRTNKQLFPLFENDIVMVMSDVPKGKALARCYLIKSNNSYSLNQRICAFRDYSANPFFLLFLLNRNNYYLRFDDGNGQTNLRKNDVIGCPTILPPLSLQQSFAEKIEAIEHQKALIQQSIAETETLFNSRMDYYFN